MDQLDTWFPYKKYRPYQRQMLEFSADCVNNGSIAMIDAPTGSGKSSVVAALLSQARGRKIIVAVRTISQLSTFTNELERIRKKRGRLKFAYLIGKRNMCPMAGEGDVYRLCEGLKAYSSSLARERAQRGSLVPAKDPFIRQQIRRMSRDHPLICPHFIQSRVFIESGEGLKMLPSSQLRVKAEQISKRTVQPDRLHEFCGELCPYDVMLQSAREADVILVNFYHLFNETIRAQIYDSLEIDPAQALLLIDEAHNCGETVQSIQSYALEERTLEMAQHELAHFRNRMKGADAILRVIPKMTEFMNSLKRSWKEEDWFDQALFSRFILGESLYERMDGIIDDLLEICDAIREKNIKAGDFRETAVERLKDFLYGVMRSAEEPSFLTIYRKSGEDISLEVRNIDPAATMKEIAAIHAATLLISGTLTPVESYQRYYFESLPVKTLSLPNAFPRENRLMFCANDITSAFSKRRDPENMSRIREYISTFARLEGNLAVYFPSYDFLNTVATHTPAVLNGKEVFIETAHTGEANVALKQFMSLPARGSSGILFGVCGGKWSEGLDYRGELLSGAMVIGLPLAPFNPVRKLVMEYFENKFGVEGEFISYTLPAINRALQALGRVIRTPEDRGVLVLGEARFLEPRVCRGLPQWMQQEVRKCTLDEFKGEIAGWKS